MKERRAREVVTISAVYHPYTPGRTMRRRASSPTGSKVTFSSMNNLQIRHDLDSSAAFSPESPTAVR